ncbi:MAG: homoserine kinase [Rickettsiales bacterium]|jgi:homoserine kinase type II|nr:homoserine kinase [Rickettsiales bacterium]
MAVYTRLTKQEIINFLADYRIGELIDFNEIIDGIDNSNFIITTIKNNVKKKFILTIFEQRIKNEELPYFINLKVHLASKKIPCPSPISNINGSIINKIKNKPAIIVSFLEGRMLKSSVDGCYRDIDIKHCQELGELIGKMHNSTANFVEYRKNDLSVANFKDLFKKINQKIIQSNLTNIIEKQDISINKLQKIIDFLEINWSKNGELEVGAVHLDLFPDNVFFNNRKRLVGVIDFYFAANDILIYDLAIAVNAWCFDVLKFNYNKFSALINGYQKYRLITVAEKKIFGIMNLAASTRFLLTRLYDKINADQSSLVKIKDPQEYLFKVNFFYNIVEENIKLL